VPTGVADDAVLCPFCEIVTQQAEGTREVCRDSHIVAFFPLEPATLGHTLVVPCKHVPDIWSVDRDLAAHLGWFTVKVAHAVKRAIRPDGLSVIQSNGAAATQTVMHLHVHVVPRWSDDRLGPIWPVDTSYSQRQKDDALDAIQVEWQRLAM
jgi:histidine triad (HIT) family protein